MPHEDPVADAEVVEGIAAGDEAALEALMDAHQAAVLRYVRTLTADPDRAEDALQETFIAAWRSAGGFRGYGSVRGWLLAIARRAVLRQGRRRAGEPESPEPLEALAQEAGWGDPVPDFERRLEARDLVDRGFAALSEEDREILVLRDLEGLGGQEAADVLGLTLAAQKSRLHRARLRFMARLEEVADGA